MEILEYLSTKLAKESNLFIFGTKNYLFLKLYENLTMEKYMND